VTGAAGFLGSHLCDALLRRGDSVVGIDNLSTGLLENLASAARSTDFEFIRADVCEPLELSGPVDAVAHLASPASPPEYLRMPIETLRVSSRGTEHAAALALRHNARLLFTSTSEIYGEPQMHPQPESYWGNVNSVGPRSVYDEAKRFGEAMTVAYASALHLNAGIVRIFNTYGPRLRPGDGRVVSNFIRQALGETALTIYGTGAQTRSFCYVDDLVDGLVKMLDSSLLGPVNLGNPEEVTILQLANAVIALTGSRAALEYHALPVDDPTRRCPDISRAKQFLQWAPTIPLNEGLAATIDWFTVPLRSDPTSQCPSGLAT
jgi:dTDP-glucose 4,6-dehydratase